LYGAARFFSRGSSSPRPSGATAPDGLPSRPAPDTVGVPPRAAPLDPKDPVMPNLRLWLESKEALDVRHVRVHEALSTPFEITLVALSPNDDLDLEASVGRDAVFAIDGGPGRTRVWRGIVSFMEQTQPEKAPNGGRGLSTYGITIVPKLWLTTYRRQNRVFQHLTTPEIVQKILAEYPIDCELRLSETHPKQDYRVQFGETDFDFINRLLEEDGTSYTFEQSAGEKGPWEILDAVEMKIVLDDAPQRHEPSETLPYADNPNAVQGTRYITKIRVQHQVRPGRHTLRDYDFKKPDFELFGRARDHFRDEFLEQYQYEHGVFTTEARGDQMAKVSLQSERQPKQQVGYESSCTEMRPGVVFSVDGHPRKDLAPNFTLLVEDAVIDGSSTGEWNLTGRAGFTAHPYRPPRRIPEPRMGGLQSAVVVGPKGDEIYTDEFGRVKVQFHWDREGHKNEDSSCWVRVSQGWSGAGYGMQNVPRIGQEVIVGFWEGNPDAPVIVGRGHNMKTQVPYKLPEEKTKTVWRTNTSPTNGGFNELSFEDKRGSELLYVQAERDMKELIKNDRLTHVHKLDTHTVGEKYLLAISSGGGSSGTFMDMKSGTTKLVSGMAMVILDGDSVTITGVTVNIIGTAEVNIVGGKIKLNC
jgi:type VI secretion system secreted protein VgrG